MRLVHPLPARSQGEAAPKVTRRQSNALTDVERMRLRAAVKHLQSLFGSVGCLSSVMGVPERTLHNLLRSDSHGSASLARKVAKAAGVTVERILGGITSVGPCPHCGYSGDTL